MKLKFYEIEGRNYYEASIFEGGNIILLSEYFTTKTETAYQLKCFAMYDGGQMYFCSIYDTKENAIKKLKEFSNGTLRKET